MRVGVDATLWTNRRGFGRFVRNAIARLCEVDPATTYVLFVDERTAAEMDVPGPAAVRVLALRRPRSAALAPDVARGPTDLLRLAWSASRPPRLDAFLFPSVDSAFPVVGVPTIVGLYDTILDEFGRALPDWRSRRLWQVKREWVLRRTTRFFTLSDAARAAHATRFGLAPERVTVVPAAPEPVFGPRTRAAVADALGPLGLDPAADFVLYAGGVGVHKNLETLLEAYGQLHRRRARTPSLVVAGPFDAAAYRPLTAPLHARVREAGLTESVRFLGFVSDEALACLYAGATAVIVPSLAEGFGLPAVEAAACGAALALSDIPPHRETLGSAARFFPPTDAVALAKEIEALLDAPDLRAALGRDARAAAARFSWDDTAGRLRELVAAVVRGD